jgi:hypothetical protein
MTELRHKFSRFKAKIHEQLDIGSYEDVKDKFIVMVNPRFKSFNKPLAIALLVGGSTFIFIIILFSVMMSAYEDRAVVGKLGLISNIMNEEASCVKSLTKLVPLVEDDEFAKGIATETSYPCSDYSLIAGYEKPALRPNYVGVGPDLITGRFVLNNNWENFCNLDGIDYLERVSVVRNYMGGIVDEELRTCVVATSNQAYPDGSLSGVNDDSNLYTIEYVVYPPFFPTLGAALGYAGFIELFITVIVLYTLSKLGFIKHDEAFMKDLIKNLIEEKGKAAEVKDHMVAA